MLWPLWIVERTICYRSNRNSPTTNRLTRWTTLALLRHIGRTRPRSARTLRLGHAGGAPEARATRGTHHVPAAQTRHPPRAPVAKHRVYAPCSERWVHRIVGEGIVIIVQEIVVEYSS